jgi:hypothetical protein
LSCYKTVRQEKSLPSLGIESKLKAVNNLVYCSGIRSAMSKNDMPEKYSSRN